MKPTTKGDTNKSPLVWGMPSVSRFAIPPGPDPFVNTPLLALSAAEDGEERFWISSYNSMVGCLGMMITESGRERVYRFDPSHRGFYGAVQEDADTLWLCGDLSQVVRLSLSAGAYETYETGAPSALVFQGLRFDPETGKIFGAAYVPGVKTFGFSFDCRNRRPSHVYETDCPARYTRGSFPNGDGTYTIIVGVPDLVFLRWDPRQETIESTILRKECDFTWEQTEKLFYGRCQRLVSDEKGRVYLPELGWYDPATGKVLLGRERPEREAVWFARKDGVAWGLADGAFNDATNKVLVRWNQGTGEVQSLCALLDTGHASACLTKAGKVVSVTVYGEFRRVDANTGALELAKKLPTDSICRVDCLVRINENRLLGTPFITQRFWEIDLETGQGRDCGRAAPGGGQVVKTWRLGGQVYMAAYTGGELVKYDPAQHPHFPENPRVVADPPGGMRPVAATQDSSSLYYSCSLEYGQTGSVLTKYDTQTGEASYRSNPIAGQMVWSMQFDPGSNSILAGTTMHADMQSCDPESLHCYLAILDSKDLSLMEKVPAPADAQNVSIVGAMGGGEYLCSAWLKIGTDSCKRYFRTSLKNLNIPEVSEMTPLPEQAEDVLWTGKPGLFVLRKRNRFDLWEPLDGSDLRPLYQDEEANIYGWHVQDDSLYLVAPREVIVLENCLVDLGLSAQDSGCDSKLNLQKVENAYS